MLTLNKILESFDWSDIGPSYDDPEITIYSGDLWKLAEAFSGDKTDIFTLRRLHDICEPQGIELRFYDETLTDEQGRVHNTSPTGWEWIPTYKIVDGLVWAQDEVDSDTLEDYAELLTDTDTDADQWEIDFSPLGFIRYDRQCESGWHPGQTDTPESLREEIEEKFGPCELIFSIDSTGQFDMQFSAWYRKAET